MTKTITAYCATPDIADDICAIFNSKFLQNAHVSARKCNNLYEITAEGSAGQWVGAQALIVASYTLPRATTDYIIDNNQFYTPDAEGEADSAPPAADEYRGAMTITAYCLNQSAVEKVVELLKTKTALTDIEIVGKASGTAEKNIYKIRAVGTRGQWGYAQAQLCITSALPRDTQNYIVRHNSFTHFDA